MKVLLLNGSPRKEGCTFTALSEVAKALNHNGIDTEIFQAGNPDTDNVKAAAAKLKEADALIAVSYTHLDVYKRQHKNCRNINSLASRQKHLRTGSIGKTKLEVLYRHDVIQ